MICGQSLQALALRFARASQAGSVETWVVSPGGKRFVTSFVAGGDGVESVISTFKKKEKIWFSCDFKFFVLLSLFASGLTILEIALFCIFVDVSVLKASHHEWEPCLNPTPIHTFFVSCSLARGMSM